MSRRIEKLGRSVEKPPANANEARRIAEGMSGEELRAIANRMTPPEEQLAAEQRVRAEGLPELWETDLRILDSLGQLTDTELRWVAGLN